MEQGPLARVVFSARSAYLAAILLALNLLTEVLPSSKTTLPVTASTPSLDTIITDIQSGSARQSMSVIATQSPFASLSARLRPAESPSGSCCNTRIEMPLDSGRSAFGSCHSCMISVPPSDEPSSTAIISSGL